MSLQEPLNIKDINFDNIIYSKCKKNQNKKIILIKYNDDEIKNFVIQTPTLLNLYKAKKYNNYSEIELALVGNESQEKVNKFINFINKLETKIKNTAREQGNKWFDLEENKTLSFHNIIRDSDDYDKGTFKLKILNDDIFKTKLLFNNNNISVNEISNNSWCKIILEFYAIWINSDNEFGLFLRPIIISFNMKESYEYKFINDSDEEIEIPETEINQEIFLNNSTSKTDFNTLLAKLKEDNSELEDNSSGSDNINNDLLNDETSDDE